MTIRKGEPWGAEVARPTELLVVGSDRELAADYRGHKERVAHIIRQAVNACQEKALEIVRYVYRVD